MADTRDNRKRMLYWMEDRALDTGQKFSSITEVQTYVNKVTNSAFWQSAVERAGVPATILVFSNGDHNSSYAEDPCEIWMAIKHWNQQVVLHELAHFFCEGHPPEYVRAYLDLIANFMGLEIAKQYRQAFKLVKVKF